MSVLIRQIDGRSLPAAGKWQLDPAHSTVEFVVRHLMVSKVRGRFSTFDVELVIGENPLDSQVTTTIDASSINTGEPQRDNHLRSADFLDVANHPTLEFRSISVRHVKGDHWELAGNLTIRGATRPVTLDVEFLGINRDPWGNDKLAIHAETEIEREDFGLTWNQALETGGVMVGKKVKVELEVLATYVG